MGRACRRLMQMWQWTAIGSARSATCPQCRRSGEIDASGLTIAPGFIDTHAHSDGVLLRDPVHAHGLVQGVTTEFITQDGLSYALLSEENLDSYGRYIAGLYGPPPTDLDMSTMAAFRSHYEGKGCNVAVQAPHGPVRLESVGFRDVPLEGESLAKAERMVAEAMEQGATGFSTGLSYYPNSYSDTDELVALNKVVARYGGVYVTHIRNHNDDRAPDGSGIVEAMNIGRRSGVKVHISHYRTFPSNAGDIDSIMSEVDQAKAEGVDVDAGVLPLRRRRDRARLLPPRRVPHRRHRPVAGASGRPGLA